MPVVSLAFRERGSHGRYHLQWWASSAKKAFYVYVSDLAGDTDAALQVALRLKSDIETSTHVGIGTSVLNLFRAQYVGEVLQKKPSTRLSMSQNWKTSSGIIRTRGMMDHIPQLGKGKDTGKVKSKAEAKREYQRQYNATKMKSAAWRFKVAMQRRQYR